MVPGHRVEPEWILGRPLVRGPAAESLPRPGRPDGVRHRSVGYCRWGPGTTGPYLDWSREVTAVARALLVAIACLGVLVGVQPGAPGGAQGGAQGGVRSGGLGPWSVPAGQSSAGSASLLDPWVRPSWPCWQVAVADVRDRLELVAEVAGGIADGGGHRTQVRSVPSRPAWLDCFD